MDGTTYNQLTVKEAPTPGNTRIFLGTDLLATVKGTVFTQVDASDFVAFTPPTGNGDAEISIQATGELLAVVEGISATDLTVDDFLLT